MKKSLLLIFCSILSVIITAQTVNNATIKTTVKGDKFDGEIIWYLKGDKVAFDMQFTHEGKTYSSRFIPDKSKGLFHILTNSGESRIYSTADAKSIEVTPGFDPTILSVEPAGEQLISGINCKKIIVKTAGTVTECYIDPTINVNYTSYETFFRSDYALLAMKELKMNGFPIAIKTKDLEGKTITEVTTTNIQQNSVTDNHFAIGKEYKTIEELNKASEQKK